MKLTPEQIAIARRHRDEGTSYVVIACMFGCRAETVKRAVEPDWAERRRQQINEARARRGGDRPKERASRKQGNAAWVARNITRNNGRNGSIRFGTLNLTPAAPLPPPKPNPSDLAIPPEQRKQLLDLRDRHCRWPVGDVDEPDFFFCGGTTEDGSSYCAHHARRSVQA